MGDESLSVLEERGAARFVPFFAEAAAEEEEELEAPEEGAAAAAAVALEVGLLDLFLFECELAVDVVLAGDSPT